MGYDLFIIAVTFRVGQVLMEVRQKCQVPFFFFKPRFVQLFIINTNILFGCKLYEKLNFVRKEVNARIRISLIVSMTNNSVSDKMKDM